MRRNPPTLSMSVLLILFLAGAVPARNADELKINPLQLVSLREARNICRTLGDEFYPQWDFAGTPVLFYRPNVQELLINYPHRPEGFSIYRGFSPLAGEIIYVRNGATTFAIDDQNTSTQIEGIPVLVVADYFSRMRNQLRATMENYDKEFINKWLDDWNFIPSPYSEIEMILHEGFHVFQDKMAPQKYANEALVAGYPLLDPVNNALYALEGAILRDALLAGDAPAKREKTREFVAVRAHRQSLLKKEIAEYENLNEYVEGTAKYVEYKFMKTGEKVTPLPEMYYQNGFNGYKGVLAGQFANEIADMEKIVSVSDDRFGNKFGAGPMRYRLYYLGACQALLLDESAPGWKAKIFTDGVYLGDLLKAAVKLSPREMKTYLEKAKADYDYGRIYQDKLLFAREGKNRIQDKLNAILNTKNTLVTISYARLGDKLGMSYTPFGVTQVSEGAAIYDLVPIEVRFNDKTALKLKKTIAVYIDKINKKITFAVAAPVLVLASYPGDVLETEEFVLSNVSAGTRQDDHHIEILLK
ncbi:MAG TPA: hypothetical protein VF451_03240 [Acidobacteriota bacterium]